MELDSDSLLDIFLKLDPKSVINLCQVNINLDNYCNNNYLWSYLMKKHYPNFDVTDNPKEQYKNITFNTLSEYILDYDEENTSVYINTDGNTIQIPYIGNVAKFNKTEVNIDDIKYQRGGDVSIYIKGQPFSNDVNMFVLLIDDYNNNETTAKVFRTRDDAAKYMIKYLKLPVSIDYLNNNDVYWIEGDYDKIWFIKNVKFKH